jgi:hypothetical protein
VLWSGRARPAVPHPPCTHTVAHQSCWWPTHSKASHSMKAHSENVTDSAELSLPTEPAELLETRMESIAMLTFATLIVCSPLRLVTATADSTETSGSSSGNQ